MTDKKKLVKFTIELEMYESTLREAKTALAIKRMLEEDYLPQDRIAAQVIRQFQSLSVGDSSNE